MSKYLILFLLSTVFIISNGNFIGFTLNGKSKLFHEPPIPVLAKANLANEIKTLWIKQKLDNFNKTETRTWDMRYLVNDGFFKSDGPLFIFLGGEWEISPGWIQGGHFYDIAVKTNAYLVYTEHRYYGQSKPTADLSVENLKYLSVDQALEDLAHFIKETKKTVPGLKRSKVILLGASYSATMATWLRRKYPNLVAGVWASSGPLKAKVDYFEYIEVIGLALKKLGEQACYNAVKKAFAKFEKLVHDKNYTEIKNKLNLCSPLKLHKKIDVWNFFSELEGDFSILVQYNVGDQVKDVCDGILAAEDSITGVAQYVTSDGCIDIDYDNDVKYFKETSWDSGAVTSGGRQWIYQTCSEFGWYQTSDSPNQPFGRLFPVDLWLIFCRDLFGEQYRGTKISDYVEKTNIIHGALHPGVTKVFFTQGELDPWRPAGIQKSYSRESPAVIYPLESHCSDMDSISSADTPFKRATKLKIKQYIMKWIK